MMCIVSGGWRGWLIYWDRPVVEIRFIRDIDIDGTINNIYKDVLKFYLGYQTQYRISIYLGLYIFKGA